MSCVWLSTLPAVLTASQVYYAGTILSGSYTLHLTSAAAIAGTGIINLADVGSGTHTGKVMTNVGGMRTTSFSLQGEEVDTTDKDSGGWRELLAGAGTVSMDISASGVYKDDAVYQAMRGKVISQALDTYMVEFESKDTYWGLFQVLSTEQSGEHNGEVTYTLELKSSGVASLIDNV